MLRFRSNCFVTVLALLLLGFSSAKAAWQLVWSDDFTNATLDTTKWTFETGNNNGWGNSEREYYTGRTNNVFVANGLLHIVACQEAYGGFPFTSARIKTQGLYSKQYGRIEFKAKLPQGVGTWPACWMLGTNITQAGWPICGEIDVMENNGTWANQVQGTIHYGNASGQDVYQTKVYTLPVSGDSVTNFHTYAVQWTSNSIIWQVDGQNVQTWTSWGAASGPNVFPVPFNQPFFLIMNLAIGGQFVGSPTDAAINAGTSFPVEMQVEYVHVYDYVLATPDTPTGFCVSPGNNKVYLSWDLSTSGASAYNIKRAVNLQGPYATIAVSPTNSYLDAGLSSCNTYYYMVSATNSAGESTNSSPVSATLGAFALAINSGGSAAGQFQADADFSGGTQASPVTTQITTIGVVNPAPQAVYQSERYGNFTYTIPGLISSVAYKLRLHFAECYWSKPGQRQFNIFINGAEALTNFDILAAAGAPNKATIQEFTVTPKNGQITIQFATVIDNAKASGIELLIPQPAAPASLAANPADAQVALHWTGVAGASYNLKRAAASAGPYSLLAAGLTDTNYTDAGLINGLTYYYEASAIVDGCEGTNSGFVSATPACTPPPAPIASFNSPLYTGMTLRLLASTITGATYQWTGPNGFSSTMQNPTIAGATPAASGIYTVTATVGDCTSAMGLTTVTINPPVALSARVSSDGLIFTWPCGTLQSATNLAGPWSPLSGSLSPYTNNLAEPQRFFRVLVQ